MAESSKRKADEELNESGSSKKQRNSRKDFEKVDIYENALSPNLGDLQKKSLHAMVSEEGYVFDFSGKVELGDEPNTLVLMWMGIEHRRFQYYEDCEVYQDILTVLRYIETRKSECDDFLKKIHRRDFDWDDDLKAIIVSKELKMNAEQAAYFIFLVHHGYAKRIDPEFDRFCRARISIHIENINDDRTFYSNNLDCITREDEELCAEFARGLDPESPFTKRMYVQVAKIWNEGEAVLFYLENIKE